MAAAGSGAKEETEEDRKEKQLIRVITPSVALTATSGAMLFSARQAVALPLFNGDAAAMTVFLSRLASAGALFEFLANPVFGKIADAIGRRPVMPVANFAVLWVRLLLFLQPNKKYPLILEQAVTIPLVTSFFTTYRAMLGDHLKGAAFARANATISMGAGVAIVTGPLFAKAVMNRMHPKYCYLVSVVLATTSLLNILFNVEETLPKEKRQPLTLSDMQPFGFLQLMRSRVLSRLMLVTGFQSFTEGRNITDVIAIFLMNDLKWGWNTINNYVSLYGTSLVLSGMTVKPMLQAFGMIKFTTFSNMCNILHLLCNAVVPPFSLLGANLSVWLGLVFGAPGARKRDAAESLIMKIGAEEGFGNGFTSGAMMNFRAIVNVIGPLLFGSLYAWSSKYKRPSIVFLVGALTVLVAEASLRTLKPKDMGLDDRGHLLKDPAPAPAAGGSAAPSGNGGQQPSRTNGAQS